jgi:diaminopimelate epimerase
MTPFVKMHGCGNDFVVLRAADLEALRLDAAALAPFVRRVCDRHYGIGADGLLAYARTDPATLHMTYWNRDGSATAPAASCASPGSAARCARRSFS